MSSSSFAMDEVRYSKRVACYCSLLACCVLKSSNKELMRDMILPNLV